MEDGRETANIIGCCENIHVSLQFYARIIHQLCLYELLYSPLALGTALCRTVQVYSIQYSLACLIHYLEYTN